MPHVLIVDKDPTQRFLIREIFAPDMSLDFSEAQDGQSAFAQLQAEPFDLVLLEVWAGKPEALNLCRTVKDTPALQEVKVVFLTIHSGGDTVIAAQGMGTDALLGKPYEIDDLETLVYRTLGMSEETSKQTSRGAAALRGEAA